MGRIVVEQIVSADGFAAAADGGIDWFQSAGDFRETEPAQLEFLERVDAILFGRMTYEMFAAYWPTAPAEIGIAEPINRIPKHVVSTTLPAAPWGAHPAASVIADDPLPSITALRDRTAGDLVVWGSLTLTDALFDADLVDELRLRIVPVLLGDGRELAPSGIRQLRLVTSRTFPRGHVELEYSLRAAEGA